MAVICGMEMAVEYQQKGYVIVETHNNLVELEHPDRTCLTDMKTGKCRLDKNHKGRHATVAFYCDACGHMRRGEPYRKEVDINGDTLVEFCFLCIKDGSVWK